MQLKRPRRFGALLAAVLLLPLPFSTATADVLLFRGDHVYVIPEDMVDKMTEMANKESWKHFPDLTRFVDTDEDQRPDFVAIALGAEGGYGAQVRYRLIHPDDGSKPRLGLWYWGVITDETGSKIFEEFNP